jgi:hypothetical protein
LYYEGLESINFEADPTSTETTNDTVTLVDQSSSSTEA